MDWARFVKLRKYVESFHARHWHRHYCQPKTALPVPNRSEDVNIAGDTARSNGNPIGTIPSSKMIRWGYRRWEGAARYRYDC